MEQSLTLLSAKIHFLDTELALIHIPLPIYNAFVQPILTLLLSPGQPSPTESEDAGEEGGFLRQRRPWAYEYPFVNISVTPVECSIACPRTFANELFLPILETLDDASREQVVIGQEDYVVVQIDGEGEALEAGQRVVELTAPLALNGIPLFFITTYFSDYILVPLKSRATVISALGDRGFVFEEHTETFLNVSSPLMSASMHHNRSASASATATTFIDNPFESSFAPLDEQRPPSTPPPSSAAELESRTFTRLSRQNITPYVDPSLKLVQCAGRRESGLRAGTAEGAKTSVTMRSRLQLGLVRCLIHRPRPRFFSLTLTDTEPASLLLEKELLAEFEDGLQGEDGVVLIGSKDTLIPVTFDLRELPMESTGIVCGVAGRLAGGMRSRPGTGDEEEGPGGRGRQRAPVEMSYLSTARAGTVMVAEADINKALEALKGNRSSPLAGVPADGREDVDAGPKLTESKPMPIRGRP